MAAAVPARLTAREGRKFALTLAAAFAAVAGILWWRARAGGAAAALLVALALTLLGLAIPQRLGPLQAAWFLLSRLLSRITTPIIMGLLYLAVFAPIGLIMRGFGHKALVNSGDGGTYLVRRTGSRAAADLERQY